VEQTRVNKKYQNAKGTLIMHATKKTNFRTSGLAALVLVVIWPHAQASIMLNARNSDASAFADVLPDSDHPDTKIQTDFLPANLSNSATATFNGVTATANCTSMSSINLDSANNSLIVTGHGTSSASRNDQTKGFAQTVAQVIRLTFTVSDVPYTWSLTGQLSAGTNANDYQQVQLVNDFTGEVLFSEAAGQGFADHVNLSGSGALSPGRYRLQVDVVSQSFSFDGIPSNGSADFDFTVQGGTPTPTPTPIQWDNAAGGSFQTATNWDPQMVPGSNDTAVFGLATAYSVDVGTATTDRLEIRNGDVTFTNSNYSVGSITFDPAGILLDNSKLTLEGGTLNGAHALIGESAAAQMVVDSFGFLNLTGSLRVGGPGNGILDITGQGSVLSGEGRIGTGVGGGEVALFDFGSIWTGGNLSVGHSGNGTLTILDGAGVVSEMGFVGFEAGAAGTVTIQGTGGSNGSESSSWYLQANLAVGQEGAGTVNVLDGGLVHCASGCSLGVFNAGAVLVEGTGPTMPSLVDVDTSLFLGNGDLGVGTLEIKAGGEVRAATDIIAGVASTAIGVIIVSGKSTLGPSLLDSLGGIHVGGLGDGTLIIKEDAAAICEFAVVGSLDEIGLAVLGIDHAAGAPAIWTINDTLDVGFLDPNQEETGTGKLILHNGAKVSAGQKLTVFPNGSICGNGTYSAPIVENNGTVCPGNSAGTLVIDGDYTQTSVGTLLMEIAGPDPGQFDVLHVTGASVLDGTMEVQMLGNFLPAAGQTFDLLQLDGSVTGDFSEITFPDLKPDFEFSAEQVGGVFKITALNDGLAANALLNISTRAQVGTGDNVLIAGFIVQGNEPKTVLLRGIGPSLTAFGVSGALANPTLELRDSDGELIFSNDDWMDSPQKQQIIDSTIPPADDLESAILAILDPGAYTTILRGANDGTGVGLVEVYDLAQDASVNMLNISTRGDVQTGDDVMIAGFIATGTTQILTRAIGPSLTEAGLANVLADPTLEVFDANGATLLANDNWKDSQQSEIEATAIPPPSDLESAALMTLEAGAYTIIVRGANETSGIGLVEVYKL